MKHSLSLAEKETIIRTDEASKVYTIYTHNRPLQSRLSKMAEEHPKLCKKTDENADWGDMTFVVQKDNVTFSIFPKREMTAAMKAANEANKDKRMETLRMIHEKQKAAMQDRKV